GVALLGVFAQAFFSTLILSALADATAKKPPNETFTERTQTINSPIGARQFVYGQVRTGGQLTFAALLGVTEGYLFRRTMSLVITFSGHEVEEIGDIWFDGEVIPLNAEGFATGRFNGYAIIRKRLGTNDDTAFAELIEIAG